MSDYSDDDELYNYDSDDAVPDEVRICHCADGEPPSK